MHPTRAPSPSRRWLPLSVALYALASAYVIYLSRDRINPDAVGYIQNARHYLSGRLDLAVNGWFGPLISWLLVPAVWMGGNTIVWFRAYNAICGVILAAGTMRLTQRMTGGRWGRLAFLAALLLSLGAVGDEITPDLLAAAALSWYFVASYGLLSGASATSRGGGGAKALAVGFLGGLCYLTKAYALMFVAGHLVLTFLFRFYLARRGQAPGQVAKSFAAAMLGMALAAAPWAAAVSYSAGRPCVSTICCMEAWGDLPTTRPIPVHLLQQPRAGRITNWENPVEIPYPWGDWGATGPWDHVGKILLNTALDGLDALWYLFRFDFLGLLLAGWVAGLATCLIRARRRQAADSGLLRVGMLWAWLSVGFYASGFLPIWVVARYLWPVWGLLLPIFACLLTLLAGRGTDLGQAPGAVETAGRGRPILPRRRLATLLSGLLLASIALRVGGYIFLDADGPLCKGQEATRLRAIAQAAGLSGRVATNKLARWKDDNWYRGLFATYWAASPAGDQAQFLGQFEASPADDVAGQLRPFGPSTVLIFQDDKLAEDLARTPGFQPVEMPAIATAPPSVHVLRYDPPKAP